MSALIDCRKIHFITRKIAKGYIKRIKAKGGSDKGAKRRVYKCRYCDNFHITTITDVEVSALKDGFQNYTN